MTNNITRELLSQIEFCVQQANFRVEEKLSEGLMEDDEFVKYDDIINAVQGFCDMMRKSLP